MAFKLNSHLENIFVRAFGTPKELSLGETKQLSINIELFQVFCSLFCPLFRIRIRIRILVLSTEA